MRKFFAIGMVLVTIVLGVFGFSTLSSNESEPILNDEDIIVKYVEQKYGEGYDVVFYDHDRDDGYKRYFVYDENGDLKSAESTKVSYAENMIRNS